MSLFPLQLAIQSFDVLQKLVKVLYMKINYT